MQRFVSKMSDTGKGLGVAFFMLASVMTLAPVVAVEPPPPINRTSDSTFPPSSQLDASPNIPDPEHTARGIYNTPDGVASGNTGRVYDPTIPQEGDTRPMAPDNSDIVETPNSGNTGIVIPAPGNGGGEGGKH